MKLVIPAAPYSSDMNMTILKNVIETVNPLLSSFIYTRVALVYAEQCVGYSQRQARGRARGNHFALARFALAEYSIAFEASK